MSVYEYSREYITGTEIYDINNPYNIDTYGNGITLKTQVETAFPEKTVNSVTWADPAICLIDMDELNENEKYYLDNIVESHKACTNADYTSYEFHHSANGYMWKTWVDNDGVPQSERVTGP
jgi:hypothetical protein